MKLLFRVSALLLVACLMPAAYGKRVPDLEFKNRNGEKQKLSGLQGSIAVVNFWATWCGPCQQEMPMLSTLTEQYADKKVRFVAISADENPENHKNREKIDKFLESHKPAMEIWLGADLDELERVGLKNVLPGTLILDENGEVICRILGQAREEDVKAPLEWLLNGRSGTPPPAEVKRY